eukprot:scaffold6615_cov172-Amphora_coffeaeformis.AAC.11
MLMLLICHRRRVGGGIKDKTSIGQQHVLNAGASRHAFGDAFHDGFQHPNGCPTTVQILGNVRQDLSLDGRSTGVCRQSKFSLVDAQQEQSASQGGQVALQFGVRHDK